MTTRPHDALFKAAFENPQHAAGLFRSVLPSSICAAIEWSTLTHEPGSFVDEQLSDSHSDLLFSARLVGTDTPVFFYLLLEHQSTVDPDMPRRMLGYLMSFWERHRKQCGGPLPIVLPILICHVPGGWTAPTSMQELFEPSLDSIADLARFVPHVCLFVEDLAHLSNEDLRRHALASFPMLALWLLRDARNPAACSPTSNTGPTLSPPPSVPRAA
jgi:predicted transposase YdaD